MLRNKARAIRDEVQISAYKADIFGIAWSYFETIMTGVMPDLQF